MLISGYPWEYLPKEMGCGSGMTCWRRLVSVCGRKPGCGSSSTTCCSRSSTRLASAGKRRGGKTRWGNHWLRTVLIECSLAATRSRDTYLSSLYSRIARRRGGNKAAVAVAHNILIAVWHILHDGVPYQELGANHFDRLNAGRLARHCVRRLQELGLEVTVQPIGEAA